MTIKKNWLNQAAITTGFIIGGVVLLLLAIAVHEGAMFLPAGGSKYGPPTAWIVLSIDSPFVRLVSAIGFFCAGLLLFVLAYKNHKHHGKRATQGARFSSR